MKMGRGFEHLSCRDRLKEKGLCSLEQRERGGPRAASQFLKGATRKLQKNISQGHVVIRQGEMALN